MFGMDEDSGGRMAAFLHRDEDEEDPDFLIAKELKELNKTLKNIDKSLNRIAGRIK